MAKKFLSSVFGIIVIFLIAFAAFQFVFDDETDEFADESIRHENPTNKGDSRDFSYFPSKYGSAGKLDGKTVIVSIFADDKKTTWKNASQRDKEKVLKYLGIAVNFLQDSSRKFGADATFIYDWTKYGDLYYEGKVSGALTNENHMNELGWNLVDSLIDSKSILEKYKADNIVYLCLVNTPASNQITSCTRNHDEAGPYEYPYEICFMFTKLDGQDETPSGYAHEILHAFGAPDLYMADVYGDNYGITEEYVKWCKASRSNDIMYTIYEKNTNALEYDLISNEFTELDAYYTGIADFSDEVNHWGFRKRLQ